MYKESRAMKELMTIWKSEDFVTFKLDALNDLELDSQQVKFLNETGLPQDAAPFPSFQSDLKTLNDTFYLEDSYYDDRIVLGSDGGGDPICLYLSDLRIYACDHEMEFENRYMNESAIKLFEFLTYFKDFLNKLWVKNSGSENYDSDFSDEELDQLVNKMSVSDPKALAKETFWSLEIQTLKANREYYIRSEKN